MILQGLLDKSIRPRYMKSYILKDNSLLTKLLDQTCFLPEDVSINERVYCVINTIKSGVLCALTQCPSAVKYRGMTQGYAKYCSTQCASQASVGKQISQESITKKQQTMLNKYGAIHNFSKQSTLYLSKQETIKTKYGASNISSNNENQSKKQSQIREKYNGKHFTQTKEYQERRQQTLSRLYGSGVTNPSHIPEVVEKRNITALKRTDQENSSIIQRRVQSIYDLSDVRLQDKDWLKHQHVDLQRGIKSIGDETGVYYGTVLNWLKRHNIPYQQHQSGFEREVTSWVDQIYPHRVITNDRAILSGKELDIVVAQANIAIECDGIYWHSDCHDRITSTYHLHKTEVAKKHGYDLVHIFENEWRNPVKRNIWKSMLANRLNVATSKLGARQCSIVDLSAAQANEFLNDNHLQGSDTSSYRYGLLYDSNIVAVMTFGRSRYSNKLDYELIRFCNKVGMSVVGGAGKLLTHFRRNHQGSIISYADRRRSSGQLYHTLGFELSHISKPNYFYWRHDPNKLFSRVMFQKHKLHKVLSTFDPNQTEYENMVNNGYCRIWDCGNLVFTLQ